jgi:outer membrane protein
MMKSLTLSVIALFLLSLALPADAKELKLGYIDSEQILNQYQDYQDAKRLLEKEEQEYTRQAKQMEMDIQNLQDEIEAQSLMWSEEKKLEKQMEGQNMVMKYQQFLQDIWGQTGKLYQRNMELSKPIIDKINVVITKIGEAEQYDFIFDANAGNIVFASPAYDLTERVLEELKKK